MPPPCFVSPLPVITNIHRVPSEYALPIILLNARCAFSTVNPCKSIWAVGRNLPFRNLSMLRRSRLVATPGLSSGVVRSLNKSFLCSTDALGVGLVVLSVFFLFFLRLCIGVTFDIAARKSAASPMSAEFWVLAIFFFIS